jgi:HEXXH motif-containing protein
VTNALVEVDVSGALWPGPDGTAADQMRLVAVLFQRKRLLAHLAVLAAEPGDPPVPRGLAERLESLSQSYFAATFYHPLFFATRLLPDASSEVRRRYVAAVPRFLLGTPVGEGLTWSVSESLLGDGGLYLPHLHTLVRGAGPREVGSGGTGPVRIEQGGGAVTFRWPDGATLQLPVAGGWDRLAPEDLLVGGVQRVEPLPVAAGLPVLNGVRELAGELWRFDHEGPTPKDVAALTAGRQLLVNVWPEAAADVRRFYHACLHVPGEPGKTYSFTNASFLGAFASTFRDFVQVGDALVHEVAHTRLAPFFDLGLIDGDDPPVHPSPWRTDLRPLRGLVNGVHAFLNVCRFYHRLRTVLPELAAQAYPEAFERHRKGILEAWPYFRQHARLTPVGEALAVEMDAAFDDLRAGSGIFGQL